MHDRASLLKAMETITAVWRDAQTELEQARTTQLAAVAPPADEQLIQTFGALVRQLDNAARELGDAIRTLDQRGRVLAKET